MTIPVRSVKRGRVRTILGVLGFELRRLGGALAPRLGIVNALGWIMLAAAMVSAGIGFLFGWQEFIFLPVTLVGGLLVAGDRALGRMVVRNVGRSRSVPNRVELRWAPSHSTPCARTNRAMTDATCTGAPRRTPVS